MRKFFTFILMLFAITTIAQVPQGFNYQAVIRNSSGDIIQDQNLSVRTSILQGSVTGNPVYTETHATQTNAFGLINLVIGQGNSSDDFTTLDWSNLPYYLKIDIDLNDGSGYNEFGTSQLLSVPFAMYAGNTENSDDADADPTNELQVLSISNDTIYLSQGSFVKLPTTSVPQQFSVSEFGDTLFLSNGNHIIIPGASISNFDYDKYGIVLDDIYVESQMYIVKTNDDKLVYSKTNMMNSLNFYKIDTVGTEVWSKQYVIDSLVSAEVRSIVETSDGSVIALFDVNSSYGYSLFVKTDTNGDTLWTSSINLNCSHVYQTSDGKYLSTGNTFGELPSDYKPILIRIDEVGDTLWTKEYSFFGEFGADLSNFYETSDGNYLFSANNMTSTLVKTNTSGDTLWTWETEAGYNISSICETIDNKYFVILSSSNGPRIIKFNPDKSIIWTKDYPSGIDYNSQLNFSYHLSNGNIIMVGESGDDESDLIGINHGRIDIWILLVDSNGEILETNHYGGSKSEDLFRSYITTNDRLLIVASTGSGNGNVPSLDETYKLWIFTLAAD